jgi:hypothetical protein
MPWQRLHVQLVMLLLLLLQVALGYLGQLLMP